VSPAKTAELVEIPFGAKSGGPKEYILDGGPGLRGKGQFLGLSASFNSGLLFFHVGVLDLPNTRHRAMSKIWAGFLYGAYRPRE